MGNNNKQLRIFLIILIIIGILIILITYNYSNYLTITTLTTPILRDEKFKQYLNSSQYKNLPENLPEIYYLENLNFPKQINENCGKFPNIFEIKFTNEIWQTFPSSNGTYQLFNAYLDQRPTNKFISTLRIIAMLDRVNVKSIQIYCQIWSKINNFTKPILISKVREILLIWYDRWGTNMNFYQPYLLSCDLPAKNSSTPYYSVSIVERQCDVPTNNLKIIGTIGSVSNVRKTGIGVCVKGLNFLLDDLTYRLIEWIELLKILGATKIIFYEFSLHPNIKKLLNYYQNTEGLVEVHPLKLVGTSSNHPLLQNRFLKMQPMERRLQEVIPYNDCFYRLSTTYKYITLLDIDEVIIPKVFRNWIDLLETLEKGNQHQHHPNISSYVFQNVYFLDYHNHKHRWFQGIPKYMHMLQHVYRSRNYTKMGDYIKCFHNTQHILTVHNHYSLNCLWEPCIRDSVNTSMAHLHHYRKDCVSDLNNCMDFKLNSVMDTTIWNYKNQLINNYHKTMSEL